MQRVARFLRRASTWSVMALATLAPAVALAQSAAPPQPALRRAPAVWIGYFVIAVLIILVLVVSLMPSKRGHQD